MQSVHMRREARVETRRLVGPSADVEIDSVGVPILTVKYRLKTKLAHRRLSPVQRGLTQ